MQHNDEEVDAEFAQTDEALRQAQEDMETNGYMYNAQEHMEEELRKFTEGLAYRPKDLREKVAQNDSASDAKEDPKENLEPIEGSTNLESLSFVRLIDPVHIPSYLVDQIKNRSFDVEKFYSFMKILCVYQTPDGPLLNNSFFLYAITNVKLRQVKGFVSFALDILNNSLVIMNFSIDKEYWNKGEAVNFMIAYAKQLGQELSVKRIVWLTKNVKACEALGFERSRESMMVFEGK